MKKIISVIAAMLTAILMLPANVNSQSPPTPPTPQTGTTFTITGRAGEAQILQINGKSYVEIETLALLSQGTLSFKANQTTLTLPPPDSEAQASTPNAKAGFSTAFVQAGIEEMSLIREWRIAIVNAVQNNIPVSEDWVSKHHRLTDKNLSLASAAASTDDDRSALPLLTAEFNNMQKLSELYLALRKRSSHLSPDNFDISLEEQILSCAREFVSMTESREFQDQASCH
jgi:hypothetical protein